MPESAGGPVAVAVSASPSTAFFLKGVLDCAGFETTALVLIRGRDLTDVVDRSQPDVIVCDVTDRRGTIRLLRRRPSSSNVPVVVVAARDSARPPRQTEAEPLVELNGGADDAARVREAARRALESRSSRPAA